MVNFWFHICQSDLAEDLVLRLNKAPSGPTTVVFHPATLAQVPGTARVDEPARWREFSAQVERMLD